MGHVTSDSFKEPFQYARGAMSESSQLRNFNGPGNFLFRMSGEVVNDQEAAREVPRQTRFHQDRGTERPSQGQAVAQLALRQLETCGISSALRSEART